MDTAQWYTKDPETLAKALSTDLATGLSSDAAAERLAAQGPNVFTDDTSFSLFSRFFNQIKSPLVFVLLLALVATVGLEKWIDSAVIAGAVIINIALGFFQEERASRAFAAIKKTQEQFAVVVRDGTPHRIEASQLVPGDVVRIESGSSVPADIRLLSTRDLSVTESALTGEWIPTRKDTDLLEEEAPLAERSNMVFMGTLVANGQGEGVVVATGDGTEVGAISASLREGRQPQTPLQRNIRSIAQFLIAVVSVIVIIIFLLGLYRGVPIVDSLLVAIAIAVAAIPEGLPAAVTVVLALGMEHLMKRGGLVRNLLAAETLGTTTVVLTDKTGTLTEGHMELAEYATLSNQGEEPEGDAATLLTAAVLASDAFVEEVENGEDVLAARGRPIEQAIVVAGLKVGCAQEKLSQEQVLVDALPFASARRYAAALREKGASMIVYASGSPELLLSQAEKVLKEGKTITLTSAHKKKLEAILDEYTQNGRRVIGVSQKSTRATSLDEEKLLEKSTFLGFLVFDDPVREGVKESIATVRGAGAAVIMVTGDNPNTARFIAREVGLDANAVYTGVETEDMSDKELVDALKDGAVFARTAPKQKLRLARILQNAGEVVAMTGDGVNDGPALRQANIGIAVGSGTDVAKEASDLILLENSFTVIEAAIEEGRRMRDNFKKIFAYLLSTNFSGMFIITGSLLLNFPLPVLPTQILWANIVGGGLMNIAFAFEPKDPYVMKRNPKDRVVKEVLTSEVRNLILIVGIVTGLFLLILFGYLLTLDLPIEEVRTIMFVALSLDSIFFALSLKNLSLPLWRIAPFSNPVLLVSLAISAIVLVIAITAPFIRTLLTTTTLSPFEFGVLVLVAVVNIITIEAAKWLFFRRKRAAAV